MQTVSEAEYAIRVRWMRVSGAIDMGDVAAKLKVMPQSPEIDLDALESQIEGAIPDGAEVRVFDREDVAFGLVALLTTIVVPDGAGGTETVEEAIDALDGVESVSVENVGRL